MSVASGRITKPARKAPAKLPVPGLVPERPSESVVKRKVLNLKARLESMLAEKSLFPASDEWHDDETMLFESLYLRQYRPLVPATWDAQLRGVPVPEIVFSRNLNDSDIFGAPPIYSAQESEFKASKAFMDIVDLTTTIRGLRHLGHRSQIPQLLKEALEKYIQWAGSDGEFVGAQGVPNIFCEIVDTGKSIKQIARAMTKKMRKVARQQEGFWGSKQVRLANGKLYESDAPVVFGLFILNHTVLILTADPNVPSTPPVSYQVEIDFSQRSQGVWNALTMGITTCLARDAIISRDVFLE